MGVVFLIVIIVIAAFQFSPKSTSSLKCANSGANSPSAFLPAVCTIFAIIITSSFMLSILLSYDTRLKKSFDPNLIICLFDSYKDLTQFSIACLLPSLRSLPSRISAPGADGCNSCTVFPNPLPPDVAKSVIFFPVKS